MTKQEKRKISNAKNNPINNPINNPKRTKEYRSWDAMKTRCTNPNHMSYPSYGGRGVTYCESWEKFSNFFKDMGPKPEGTSIDRINPYGNYEPSNCRWADAKTQASNKRKKKT